MPRPEPIEIPHHLLLPLEEAISRLPNVKPRLVRRQLDRAFERLAWKRQPRSAGGLGRGPAGARVKLGAEGKLGYKEVHDLFVRVSERDEPRITPEGAAVLVRLYEAGAFEPAKPRLGRSDPADLRAYAASRDALEARAAELVLAEQERAARRRRWITHPEEVPEAEFGFRLLDEIFRTHRGSSPEERMEIGGVLVRKSVRASSITAESAAPDDVSFTWTGSDGEVVVLERAGPLSQLRDSGSEAGRGRRGHRE